MRHKAVIITSDDLAARIERDSDDSTQDAQEVREAGGVWRVTWPEHVLSPRFDSDASWSRIADKLSAALMRDYGADSLYDCPGGRSRSGATVAAWVRAGARVPCFA